MPPIIDQQLKHNDCGISAIKTVCNILNVDISREIIVDKIPLNADGASLKSIQQFFDNYGFTTQYKLLDVNTINTEETALKALFPCITPVKRKRGLHYIILNGLQDGKFLVYDPAKTQSYKLTVQEFKKQAYFSSSYLPYVEVAEQVSIVVGQELAKRAIKLPHRLSPKEMMDAFNKITYFSYIEEQYGFKTEEAANAFLKDLIFNQDLASVPSHFRGLQHKKNKVQLRAPIWLSIQKNASTRGEVLDDQENIYVRLIKSIHGVQDIWGIFVLTTVIAAFITYIAVFINQILIDHVLPAYDLNTLIVFAVGVGIFSLCDLVFYVYKKFITIHLGNVLDRYFLYQFDTKLNTYSIRFLQSFRRGDITERLSDAMALKAFFLRYFSRIFINAIIALFSISILMFISWKLSIIVFMVMIAFAALFYFLTPLIQELEQKRFAQKAQFFSKFIEKIDGIQVIKSLRLEHYSSSEIRSNIDGLISIQTKAKYLDLLNSVISTLVVTSATLAIIVLTAREMILFNTITLGMIITYIALSGKIFSAFKTLLETNLSLQEHKVILNRFFNFTETAVYKGTDNTIKQPEQRTATMGKVNKIEQFDFSELVMEKVAFAYIDDNYVLKDVSLHLNKGDKIWIQGANGSGKSTLCKILSLLYAPNKGEILINGVDMELYATASIKRKVALISSDDLIFNNTLLFNVTFEQAVDLQRLVKYAKAINFYEFISKQPDKLNYMLHENGRNLSTGQRKKVLLLRALMLDVDIILLDEIFNGMDQASKAKAEQLLNTLTDKTFIIISHMPVKEVELTAKYQLKNGVLLTQTA